LGAFALAVNSGGGAVGPFVADASFAGGTQAAPVTSTIDTSGLAAPAPQAVYQTERYGNFIYTFTGLIPGTSYNVRLHFAETYWTGIGQRRFNIFINGNQVLTNFDIIAAAGAPNKATIQEFLVPANGVGQMVIQYTTVTDNAKASGMEILLPRPAAPAVANNSPIFAGMSLNLTASPVSGASYSWTGPNGFASTNQNPTLANVTTNAGGLYFVTAAVGNCASAPSATSVAINPPATVSITSVGSNITITWPGGTLQSATNLTGPWRDLNGTNSPYVLQTNGLQQFYRIKLQ
jgi:hypothetical protein